MRRIDVHGLVVRGLAGCLLALVVTAARAETPKLAHFRFDGDAKDEIPGNSPFDLRNTQFTPQGLFLNGK